MNLSSSHLRLQFSETGELTELYDEALQRNYLDAAPRLPLFRITFSEFLNGKIQPGEFHLSSALAEEVTIDWNDSKPDTLSITFKHIDGQDLNAFCTVRLPEDSALSYWQIRIENHTDYAIKAVEYPMIATHLTPSGKAGPEIENTRILLPKQDGYLLPCPLFMPWEGDNASRTRNQRFLYPGEGREDPNGSSVQLQAFYDELGGLYMATHDSAGNVKEFGPIWVHEEDATRLTAEEFSQYAENESDRTAGTDSASSAENAADPSGHADGISSGDPWLTDSGYLDFSIVHHTPEAPGNVFAPDYDTVIGCFEGDWQDAALIYKAWSKTQPWCEKTIANRPDIPDWLKQGVFFFNFRLRFQKDGEAFLDRLPDYLELWQKELNIPLVAMMCGWEKFGEWAGPDYFPPYGGEERFRRMSENLHKKGIYVFPFGLSGLKLPIRKKISRDFSEPHLAIDYDNREFFEKNWRHQACIGPDGGLITDSDIESWDGLHAYACVTTPQAHDQLYGATMKLIDDYDIDISQADQVLNGAAVECYNPEHGHPLGRGKWQIEALQRIYDDTRRDGKAKKPGFILSEEWISEPFLQHLDVYHGRNYDEPRGLTGVPLFSFLYHEYLPCYGGDWTSFLPENTSGVYFHAHNFVTGNLPAGCPLTMRHMKENKLPSDADPRILTVAKNACAVYRRFPQFLVLGEMLLSRALPVPEIDVDFFGMIFSGWKKHRMKKPAVLHHLWKDPAGHVACALANISETEQVFCITVPEESGVQPSDSDQHYFRLTIDLADPVIIPADTPIRLAPLSAAMVEFL